MSKLIVTVAPTSNFHGKDANPALPFSPEEVTDSVYECWNEGASIVHIHGRDAKGLPTNDPGFFQQTDGLIRDKQCDIIIQHSMAPANPVLLGLKEGDVNDGMRTTNTTPPPEMASLEVAPSNIIAADRTGGFNKTLLCQFCVGNAQGKQSGIPLFAETPHASCGSSSWGYYIFGAGYRSGRISGHHALYPFGRQCSCGV
ncbi:MAG: 3-keto-5-aminohexanoate cleavage protein [Deltaproteobacteria bacterium]|nr:3-keto-5-aminohexanoate cleavage protein [Deltaproteobacteria bacterium]